MENATTPPWTEGADTIASGENDGWWWHERSWVGPDSETWFLYELFEKDAPIDKALWYREKSTEQEYLEARLELAKTDYPAYVAKLVEERSASEDVKILYAPAVPSEE